jgi:hypothetical protein
MVRAASRELVEVSVERPSERHVQDLASPADPEEGHVVLNREEGIGQIDLVEERLALEVLRMRLPTTVPPRLDVAPARQDEAVDPLDQVDPVPLVLVVRQEDRQSAHGE